MSKRGCRSGTQQRVGGSLQGTGWSQPVKAADDFPPLPAAVVHRRVGRIRVYG
jgi:hypothetical protein